MDAKRLEWLGSSYRDLLGMPENVQRTFGYALGFAQNGLTYADAKTLKGFSPAVVEVLEDDDGDTYRTLYVARYKGVVYVLHCFKKGQRAGAISRNVIRPRSRPGLPR